MMHTLMSFLGYIGTLMRASGVEVLMGAAFGGITSIFNGKAWTNALQYASHHRCVVAEFLLEWHQAYQELGEYLETARQNLTGRIWVDCLIKPTLLALMFLRGERNGDFILQQHSLKAVLPYFFEAGHHNYARYLSWYVQQMKLKTAY